MVRVKGEAFKGVGGREGVVNVKVKVNGGYRLQAVR
jgi:hypothetical protein